MRDSNLSVRSASRAALSHGKRKCRVEPLERRQLLSAVAAIDVWAGNTFLTGETPYSVDQAGYTKIGQSNQKNGQIVFSGTGSYDYIVIATRARVNIDAIKGSDTSFYTTTPTDPLYTGATDNNGNVTGTNDGAMATVGKNSDSNSTYSGYLMFHNRWNWSSFTLYTGDISLAANFNVGYSREFIPGTDTPYGYEFWAEVNEQGLVSSGRVHTPAGRWFDLGPDDSGNGLEFSLNDTSSLPQLDSLIGDGNFTFELQSVLGTQTITISSLDAGNVEYPTQIPSLTTPLHGLINVPTSYTFTWPSMAGTGIDNISLRVEDGSYNEIVNSWWNNTTTTSGSVTLQSNAGYTADLEFENGINITNASGYDLRVGKGNSTNFGFCTTGTASTLPDLTGTVTASSGSYQPGDNLSLNINVANNGGPAFGKIGSTFTAISHVFGLSTDKTWGNADDIVLFNPTDFFHPAGWSFSGSMTVQIPDVVPAGSYYLMAAMDIKNVVAESSGTNNMSWSASANIIITTPAASLNAAGILAITGTASADSIGVTRDALTIRTVVNGKTRQLVAGDISSLIIDAAGSNDVVTLAGALLGASVSGGTGNDTLTGGDGNDTLIGGAGDDSMVGGGGNDVFKADAGDDGADIMVGGGGFDGVDYSLRTSAVKASFNGVADDGSGNGAEHDNIGTDIEGVVTTNYADYIAGSSVANYINGMGGNDTIYGAAGNDTLIGGDGNDSILAGAGNDSIEGQGGNDWINGEDGNDMILGGDGTDWVAGGNGSDTFYGGTGNDTVYGGPSADVLYGEGDNDLFWGGAGNDTIYGGAGNDTAVGELDNDSILGGDGNDTLVGTTGDDVIRGEAGLDSLLGNGGSDTLYGGASTDFLDGGTEGDLLYGDDPAAPLEGNNDKLAGGDGNDTLYGGKGNDSLWGNANNDSLFGESGNDLMYGGADNDTLDGGAGNDIMIGEAGDDLLVANDGERDTLRGDAGNDTALWDNGTVKDYLVDDTIEIL